MRKKQHRRGGRDFGNGRTRSTPRYIKLPHAVFDHPAVQSLTPSAFKVWMHLQRRFNGFNNGSLAMSCRECAQSGGMSKNTVSRALEELRQHGLVVVTMKGQYRGLLASEFELTHESADGQPPSRLYEFWDIRLGQLIVKSVPEEVQPASKLGHKENQTVP